MLRGGGAVTGFFVTWLLWRYVGRDASGLFFLAMTCRNVADTLGKAGFERVLVRSVAAHAATDDIAGIHGAHGFAIRRAIRSSLLYSAILAALAWPLAEWVFHKPITGLLLLMALTVLPVTLVKLGCSSLRGLKRTVASQFIDSLAGPLIACVLLPVFALQLGVEGVVIGRGLSMVCAASLALLVWRRVAPPLDGKSPTWDATELTQASRPLLQTDLMNLLMSSLPLMLLGMFWAEGDIGIYGIALRTALLIAFIQMGLNAILAPKFAAMWKLEQLDALRKLARNASWLAFFAALPVAALFCLAPGWVLSMFDRDATAGAMILVVLTVAQLINVASGPVGSLLVMTGHQRLVRNGALFTLVLQLGLSCWLIPIHGPMGAALTTAAGMVVKNVINIALVRRHLGVRLF